MREALIHALGFLPPEWTTLVISMLPIVELRGAIPYAIGVAHLPWPEAYLLAVAGNLVPVVPILLLIGPVTRWLDRLPGFGRFFEWLFARTRRKSGPVDRYGPWGLALFVAIPLPATGAWTGALLAFLLGIRFRRSFPAITAGVLVAGMVVTLAVTGVVGLGGLLSGR